VLVYSSGRLNLTFVFVFVFVLCADIFEGLTSESHLQKVSLNRSGSRN
jgi:hypothetical protein